jgi:hypothetical protein
MTKRRVMTYERRWDWDEYVPVEAGEGTFVQYGVDFAETRDGTSQYTSAIVEMPDGRVRNYPLHMIRFLKEEEE